jgi:hypothetical protein
VSPTYAIQTIIFYHLQTSAFVLGAVCKDWLAAGKASSVCKLFSLPGVTALAVAYDYMHCKYLGVDGYLFGSVFWLLCFQILPGTPKENLAQVWAVPYMHESRVCIYGIMN